MDAFINIRFDTESTRRIQELQSVLADEGISEYASWLGYPPHITLVRCDNADPSILIQSAAELARSFRKRPIPLVSLSLFTGISPVLWLGPLVTSEFLADHRKLCERLPWPNHDHYQPDQWFPHATVAAGMEIAAANAALSKLLPTYEPIVAMTDAVEVVSFPPAKVVWRQEL
ncbi:MAG: 2'-5' RNA ligase family protein [Devosia sp.]